MTSPNGEQVFHLKSTWQYIKSVRGSLRKQMLSFKIFGQQRRENHQVSLETGLVSQVCRQINVAFSQAKKKEKEINKTEAELKKRIEVKACSRPYLTEGGHVRVTCSQL